MPYAPATPPSTSESLATWPSHQPTSTSSTRPPTPRPRRDGDHNFYDRYFFNGYRRDGDVYFAVAMGVYPNLGVMDAAFSVIQGGRLQYYVRASRFLGDDRMDTRVGPISVQIVGTSSQDPREGSRRISGASPRTWSSMPAPCQTKSPTSSASPATSP